MTSDRKDHMAAAFERLTIDREADVRERLSALTGDDKILAIAQETMDVAEGCLDFLCNFSHAVNHEGKRVDTTKIAGDIKELMETEFERMFGRPYRCPTLRRIQRENPQ